MKYYQATNFGKGFITHEDSETAYIQGHPADIYVTENEAWAARVGAVELTKEQAQELVNASLEGKVYPERHKNAGEPVTYLLP